MCSLYIIMSHTSNFIFILCYLRKNVKCNRYICSYNCYSCIYFSKKKKNRKKDPSFGLGKKLKSYATIAPLSIFSLGKGRETLIPQILLKTLKYCKVCFLTNPYNTLVQISSVSVTHFEIVQFCKISCIFSMNFAPFQ